MNKCEKKKTNRGKAAVRGRIAGRVTKRTRRHHDFELRLHDLGNGKLYKVHRYTLTPSTMAVRTNEEIRASDLLLIGGEVLKVARVEEVSEGCVEVKGMYFPRYNQ